MALNIRIETVVALIKGVLAAVVVTLVGMAILAAIVVFTPVSDGVLLILNQILKVISILLGTVFAVGLGGKRGFALGAVIGLLYMVLGYAVYCILDGSLTPPAQMVGEFLMGTLIGALCGAITANLKPVQHKRKVHTKKVRML